MHHYSIIQLGMRFLEGLWNQLMANIYINSCSWAQPSCSFMKDLLHASVFARGSWKKPNSTSNKMDLPPTFRETDTATHGVPLHGEGSHHLCCLILARSLQGRMPAWDYVLCKSQSRVETQVRDSPCQNADAVDCQMLAVTLQTGAANVAGSPSCHLRSFRKCLGRRLPWLLTKAEL